MRKKDKFQQATKLPLKGDNRAFYSLSGLPLFNGYTRVVIGDRGAYVEFDRHQFIEANTHIPPYQLWREKSDLAYYIERRSNCLSETFIYDQLKTVAYADYKIGMLYVHPSLLMTDETNILYDEADIQPANLNDWWMV